MSNFENDPQFEQLKSRLQQNPDSLIFARVAEGLLNRGQVEEAIRICEEGIRKHPYYITGHMVLGKCYLQKKLFDLAEKEFKRVLLFDPKYIAAHKFYGDLMREVGWENTCEMSYRKILQIDPLDRTAKEMLETLEKVRPREKEVVTPEQGTDAEVAPQAQPADEAGAHDIPNADLAAMENAAVAQPPEAEGINLDDDLFAEVKSDVEPPEPAPEVEASPEPALDDTDVSGILEDIFEEETPREEAPGLEEFALDKTEEPQKDAPIVTEEQPAPEPVEERETPPVIEDRSTDEDPLKALDQFEEETLEIEQFDQFQEDTAGQQETADQAEQDIATREFLESTASAEEPEEEGQDLFAALDSLTSESQDVPAAEESAWDQPPTSETSEPPESDAIAAIEAELTGQDQAPQPEPQDYELPSTSMLQEEEPTTPASETPSPVSEPAAAEPQPSLDTAGDTAVRESTPPSEPASQPATAGADSGAANSRERIVTPTLGEIYAAQGQFAKAINVFEMLLKKDPNNAAYKEKIEMLKKRLEENQNGG